MAKKVTKEVNYTTPSGKQVKKTSTVDTSKQTGRQKTRIEKKELSNNAKQTAIVGEVAASAASTAQSKHSAEVQKERERQKTYQAAINKWNGILKSTPEPVEGSNDPMEGSSGAGNTTGDNQWKGF